MASRQRPRAPTSPIPRLAARAPGDRRAWASTRSSWARAATAPLLCLVQVAVDGARTASVRVDVLDPLDEPLDPAPLAAVLADPAVEIVLHAGRQDVALLRRVWQHRRDATSSTRRSPPASPGLRAQLGYEALLHEMLGVRLRKSASFTRWDARPLTDEQLDYAREDVLHLLELADALQERARRPRAARVGARGVPRARGGHRRARARGGLRPPAARQLARPRPARRRARARRSGARTARARRTGRSQRAAGRARWSRSPSAARSDSSACAQIRGLHEGTLRRRGQAILDAVERGRERAPIPVDGERPPPSRPGRRAADRARRGARARPRGRVRARLRADRRARRPAADRHRAARPARREPDVRTLQGWRRELVGAELLELLAGRRSLRVGPGRRIEVSD